LQQQKKKRKKRKKKTFAMPAPPSSSFAFYYEELFETTNVELGRALLACMHARLANGIFLIVHYKISLQYIERADTDD
jgi:hypothetical protein